jgi:hypothetical protein
MKNLATTGLALMLALASAAPAEAETTYHCTFSLNSSTTAIAPEVILVYDEASGEAAVIDGIIQNYVGAPLPARLRSSNAVRLLFGWTLPGVKTDSGQWVPRVEYSLNIQRQGLTAQISATPGGNYVPQRASGSCTAQ